MLSAHQLSELNLNRRWLRQKRFDAPEINRKLLLPIRFDFEKALAGAAGDPPADENLHHALEWVIGAQNAVPRPGVEILSRLGALLVGSAGEAEWRSRQVEPIFESHQPLPAAMIGRALERFFEWIESDAFQEMHVLAQMTLTQVRLLEVFPFDRFSRNAVFLFSACFPLSAGHPLPVAKTADEPTLGKALSEAFQLSTDPLTSFNLEMCQQAYGVLRKEASLLKGDW